MFGKKRESSSVPSPQSGKFDTLLGPDIKLTGAINGKGSLRIEGEVDGEIDYDGNIIIGENARVKATVKAINVTIAGHVQGNVTVESRLEVVATGKLIGDMSAQTFVVAEGALFQGQSDMDLEGAHPGEETERQTEQQSEQQSEQHSEQQGKPRSTKRIIR